MTDDDDEWPRLLRPLTLREWARYVLRELYPDGYVALGMLLTVLVLKGLGV